MRLWHKYLISALPRQQLLSQWRECCCIAKSIAETGTPNHVLVNRILDYPIEHLQEYTDLILAEIMRRGYSFSKESYRKFINHIKQRSQKEYNYVPEVQTIYPNWHNDTYLRQCLYNLEEKAICGGIPADEWEVIYNEFKDFTPLWHKED